MTDASPSLFQRVWSRAWQHYLRMLPAMLPVALAFAALSVLLGIMLNGNTLATASEHANLAKEVTSLSWMPSNAKGALLQLLTSLIDLLGLACLVSGVSLQMNEAYSLEKALKHSLGVLLYLLALNVVVGVSLMVASVLIVPAVYLAVRWVYGLYFVLERRLGPIKSLKASWALLEGRWWMTAMVLFSPVMAVGMLCFLADLLVPAQWFNTFMGLDLDLFVHVISRGLMSLLVCCLYVALFQAYEADDLAKTVDPHGS